MVRSDDSIELGGTQPLPVVSVDDSTEPMPVLPIASAFPRFCRSCGAAWQLEWAECVSCAVRNRGPQAVPLTIASEWRAMKSSLWLYFSLLLVCAIGLGLSKAFGGVKLELWVEGSLSAITIAWCFASARSVLPALRKQAGLGWYALALGLSLATYGIAVGVIRGANTLTHTPSETMSKPFLDAGYTWAAVVLFTCVQPALIEELAFRGVIFAGLIKALSAIETVLVAALMFMILHLAPGRFPHTLALGVGAGFLRYRTKSVYPGMLMHFSHNFLCVAGEWLAR